MCIASSKLWLYFPKALRPRRGHPPATRWLLKLVGVLTLGCYAHTTIIKKMKPQHTWWEISFYLSLLIIILWLILKLTGVINTPPVLEYGVPIFSATYAFFALYRDFLDRINRIGNGLTRAFMKIEHLENEVGSVKEEVGVMRKSRE